MARLVLMQGILRKSAINNRRNERRIARYMGKAFSMPADEFRRNYRVTKDLFNEIYEELRPHMKSPRRRSDITPKYKILVALSFFATGSYQKLVGGTYGTLMSQKSVSRAIREVTNALNVPSVLNKWIKFPQTFEERNAVKRQFYEKFGIPAVLGCIDGTHVAIIRPKENEERYFNRKHFHSRNVLIICDADLNIMAVDASFGGATHDSFVFNQSVIKTHLMELVNSGEIVYLLGDSGYAQREYMMTPIIDAPEGSPEENYTAMHCSARNTVERTIGVLKNRWRCLLGHRVLHYHPDVAAKIIIACCVLHNMCNKREILHLEVDNFQVEDNPAPRDETYSSAPAELRVEIERRALLVQQLWRARR